MVVCGVAGGGEAGGGRDGVSGRLQEADGKHEHVVAMARWHVYRQSREGLKERRRNT